MPDGTAVVRLHDATTGELFAESPLGVDVPIQAVVEPVVLELLQETLTQ